MTARILPGRLQALTDLELHRGDHRSFDDGHCAAEAVAWLAGEEHTDHPTCMSPIIGQFLRTWNDDLDNEGRQHLKTYLPRAIGTANDGHDETRGWMCADWLIRVHTPAWLELAGCNDSAAALRGLPALVDAPTLAGAQPALDTARAAGDAAGAAAWDAAWAAAWAAARAAARAAAGDAAGAAARAAARDAAGDAARDAARAAAGDAARAALAPTKVELQTSARDLLDAMLKLGEDERQALPEEVA